MAKPPPPNLTLKQHADLTRRITQMSVATALVLSVIKAVAWYGSGSVAMLGSLADSGLDLVASLATFFAVRYAAAPPDHEHRYGHGKAEAFASLVQAGLVFASAALVGQAAISHLLHPVPIEAQGWDMAVMAVSILLTSLLVAAQSRVLSRGNSVAVTGDRMHYAADLGSNVVALLAIGLAALLHRPEPDAIGGILVAAWLVWGAVSVFRASSTELMDHELPDESRAQIVKLMTEQPGITDVHQLRTRASGPYVHIQLHAGLDPDLSLIQAHRLMVAAEKRVLKAFPAADIIIHPDPHGRAEPHGGAFAEFDRDEESADPPSG